MSSGAGSAKAEARWNWSNLAALAMKIAAVLWFAFGDPFGLKSVADDAKQNVITRLAAPFYPDTGQRHITAVVLDDEAAEKIAEGYPMPLGGHAQVLRRILCADPAAVFIDINFRVVRGGVPELERLLDALSLRKGPDGCAQRSPAELKSGKYAPVYLAVIRSERNVCPTFESSSDEACKSMVPLRRLLDVVQTIDVTDMIQDGRYEVLRAPIEGKTPEKFKASFASPALAMVDALCRKTPNASDICNRHAATQLPPMALQWGYFLSRDMAEAFPRQGCETRPYATVTTWDRSMISMRLVLDGMTGKNTIQHVAHPCPYTDQISAASVIDLPSTASELSKALTDRLVVYGADITALPDQIDTPVHGRLPGLFQHTMAADNLITRGTHYWRDPPRSMFGQGINAIIEAVLAVMIVLVAALLKRQQHGIARKLTTFALFLAIFLAIAAYELCILHWAPVNALLLMLLLFVELPPWRNFATLEKTRDRRH